MKWLREATLKQIGILVPIGLLILLLAEFAFLRGRIVDVEKSEETKDFARGIQLHTQEIAYLSQLHLAGTSNLEAEILSRLGEVDYSLGVLEKGGRIPNSSVVIDDLPALPKITFDNLRQHYLRYQEDLKALIAESNKTSGETDSLSATTNQAALEVKLAAEWLSTTHWFDRLMVDLSDVIENRERSFENLFLLFLVIDIALAVTLFFVLHRMVLVPVERLTTNTKVHIQTSDFRKDEIGGLALEINNILEQLKDATDFVAAIGEGQLDFDYKTLDANYQTGQNRLADSLISMQAKLKALNIEEQRRQWANEGLTKFVDILRSSNDNINTLGDKIISALVKYTSSNQGGLYILNDEDERNKYLELISLFAFDTKKFEKQKLKPGEGILGQTFLEKETTVLKEIPEEYVRITSGLGSSNPKALLIVPLKVDQDVYGIVELASFKEYQDHEIAFVEKLAETIASTLASVKVAHKNRYLIEQFQQQTEEMRSQEEEMRQNMEELQATQEELSRKEQDYIHRIAELEQSLGARSGKHQQEIDAVRQSTREEYAKRIEDLENRLAQVSQRSQGWEVAEELGRGLRIQLEAMKISAEEARKK